MKIPPRIGITTSLSKGEQTLELTYVRAVERAGGLPFILPVLQDDAMVRSLVFMIDGLVVTGGPAVTDGLIGVIPDDLPYGDPLRRENDKTVLSECLAKGKPVLGICYGMQMLNAVAGGSVYADVQRQVENALPHSESRGAQPHIVNFEKNSKLHRILGKLEITVNTSHIQAIAQPGEGLRVTAHAPDGVIEAVENDDGTAIGVQFHPERMPGLMGPLFDYFVEQCRSK